MSDEKKEVEKQKLKERMNKLRQEMSQIEINQERKAARERMGKLRDEKLTVKNRKETLTSALWEPGLLFGESQLYMRQKEMEKNRIKEKRKNMSDQEREAEKQGAKKRMRKRRLNQTREERQVQNERNKKRMRESRKKNKTSEEDSDISCDKDVEGPSDIVKRLNQEYRQMRMNWKMIWIAHVK